MMAASEVEMSSVEMTPTSAVTVTATLLFLPYSLLSFSLEVNGLMKIVRASWSLNRISTIQTNMRQMSSTYMQVCQFTINCICVK